MTPPNSLTPSKKKFFLMVALCIIEIGKVGIQWTSEIGKKKRTNAQIYLFLNKIFLYPCVEKKNNNKIHNIESHPPVFGLGIYKIYNNLRTKTHISKHNCLILQLKWLCNATI